VSTAALIRRTREHLSDPLYRNAYALMASTVLTSVLGVAFWVTAARLYPAEVVGRDTALILAMQGLALVGQLNLGTAVVRFLPQVRRRARRAVLCVYVVSAAGVAVLTTLFVLGAPRAGAGFDFLAGEGGLAAGYVAAVVLWVIFVLQDAVLTATRRTTWVPIENALYGALKLAAVIALASGAVGHGILVAWIVPAALIVPVISWLLFTRVLPAHAASHRAGPSPLEAQGPRALARFLGQDYLGSILGQASLLCLPLLVVALLGSTENAYFAIPFALAMTFDLLFHNGATSLTVEGAHDERAARDLTRRLVRRVFGPLALVAFCSALVAPLLLWPYGPDYVTEGGAVLRLLLLAGVFRATIYLFIAIMRLRRQSGVIMATEGTLFVLLLTLTLTLGPALGREGVGIAWLVANGVVALSVAPWIVRFLRASDDAPEHAPLRLVSAATQRLRHRPHRSSGAGAALASPVRSRPSRALVGPALAACVLAPLLVLAGITGPVTLVAMLAFVLLVPGTTLVGWLRPDTTGAGLGLVIGTSLAVSTVVATAMLQVRWAPHVVLCAVALACGVPLARQWTAARPARQPAGAAGASAATVVADAVSVIVVAGGSGVALRRTLRSVLDAEVGDVQVIVVDAVGGTVATLEAIASLADSRLLYTCAPDAGAAAARDAGLRVATGTLVIFPAPDSVVHEGWVEALVAPFADAGIGCVIGRLPEREPGTTVEALLDGGAGRAIGLLWDGELPIAFATRRETAEESAVAYAADALAWPQVVRGDATEAIA
jgi:O-antigen/teichoic acid export membrane protein